MKKLTALMMSLLMLLLCAACAPKEQLTVNVAAMKGPTGIGMAQLSSLAEEGKTEYNYSITYAGSPDEVTGGLISGELDIAAVPVNLGAVLFNKTEGQILTAAVNTLGVLYVVENGNSVQSIADLAGRKILAAGQGSTPEYILNYILDKNGLAGSVEVEYAAEHAEAVTKLASGEADIIVVPEPFVTTALSKAEGARIAPSGKAYPMLSWFRAVWWCARPLPMSTPRRSRHFSRNTPPLQNTQSILPQTLARWWKSTA